MAKMAALQYYDSFVRIEHSAGLELQENRQKGVAYEERVFECRQAEFYASA